MQEVTIILNFYAPAGDFAIYKMTFNVLAPPMFGTPSIQAITFDEGLRDENVEGFIAFLELGEESEFDARDVGQVELVRNSYLIRINTARKQICSAPQIIACV